MESMIVEFASLADQLVQSERASAVQSISLKIATVGKPPTINGFAAQVACSRGLTAEVFPERQPALDWLTVFGSKATAS